MTGGCRCGAVRYRLAVAELPRAYACHCRNCQTWSGSAFAQQLLAAEDAILIEGPVVDYLFTSPSGSTSHQRICGECHCRIYNSNDARPGIAVVRAGTLDESDRLDTPLHIWVKRKQPWLRLPDDAVTFAENATFAAMLPLFAPRQS